MNHSDIAALMKGAAPVIRDYVAGAMQPILARLDAIDKRIDELPIPKDGINGKDAEPQAVAALAIADVRKDLEAFFETRMGEQRSILLNELSASIPAAPELPDVPAMVAKAVAAIPVPQNGKDADPEQVAQLVREEAGRILAGWERPQDGKDGAPGLNGEKGADGLPGKDGLPGNDGRDGLDAVEFFRDDNGHLIVTMSNGTTRDLGEFIGRDGKDGIPGEKGKDGSDAIVMDEGAPIEIAETISLAVKMMAQMPETKIVAEPETRTVQNGQPITNIHLPPINIPELKFPDNVVNLSVPEQKMPDIHVAAPVVNVSVPEQKRRKTETTVTAHDSSGRISKFVQKELD